MVVSTSAVLQGVFSCHAFLNFDKVFMFIELVTLACLRSFAKFLKNIQSINSISLQSF